jgi:SAM-dependent methyltransferase
MRKRSGGTDDSLRQFHELAQYYDALNDWKNYRAEAAHLEAVARRWGRRGRTVWLDVACGTGRHLEYLRRSHFVVGLDGSRDMLRIARRRLPGVRLVLGDMRTFQLGRQFDVVSCLFSAIGHLPTKRDVRRTFECIADHLKVGGVVIIEPWLAPSVFRRGTVHLRIHESSDFTVVRMAYSSRRGNRSGLRWHFLVGKPGRGIRHFEETDIGLLLSKEELLQLMRDAGFRPRYLARGLTRGRGLLIGIKN